MPSPAFTPALPVGHTTNLATNLRCTTFLAPTTLTSPLATPVRRRPTATLQSPETPAPETHATPTPKPAASATVLHFFRREPTTPATRRAAATVFGPGVTVFEETCFNVGLRIQSSFSEKDIEILTWLLAETFQPENLTRLSTLPSDALEVGPRLNFQTAWSANAVSICNACGIKDVVRVERSRRYAVEGGDARLVGQFVSGIHDRMTECVYEKKLTTFETGMHKEMSYEVDVINGGAEALAKVSEEEGLGFDEQDIEYYLQLFKGMGRNPTNVELFDLAQSNSEHSRHWFFKGRLVIDGEEMPNHLLDIVRETLKRNPTNSVVAFADNSSTIRGSVGKTLVPHVPGSASPMRIEHRDRDVLFTAETHNFPSGVAPFPGAETGTGGRIRDTAATGIGSLVVAGTAGYAVGNLNIPEMKMPWEEGNFLYPDNLASPLEILINASNGASDYGNKFGEPVINGFARTYGVRFESGERREYVKPIMFSGGMGQMDHAHAQKGEAELGLLVVKVGGPAYRIGMGGGAASSMMQGDNKSELDFNAVQRGDAEMAQKVYRVLRACVEMGAKNPIVSIHDQGAGGNCNVVKELIYPAGATIDIRKVWVGDTSLSALEIWGAEYQEQFGLLLRPDDEALFRSICSRENVVPVVLGTIDGSGHIVLWDEDENKDVADMDLEQVLGDLPQKTFVDSRVSFKGSPILPQLVGKSIGSLLDRVLRLMSVGSKRFLTNKVDRSVTGLIAQQQCVGPLQIPLADYAVTAKSHFELRGSATSIGERPSITMLSPGSMARICVGEMMTNIAGVKLTGRRDIKCEGNWMWAAKLPGDCASLYDAAVAMRDIMIELEVAVDGGKDSLSMAAKCPTSEGQTETVRAPGTLVVTGYSTVDNINSKLTPDIKAPGTSVLLHVDIAQGKRRLGGSSLAQVFGQVGDNPPDVDDSLALLMAFDLVQELIEEPWVLSYHDVSDGGVLCTILEMGFAGNCGMDIAISSTSLGVDYTSALFAEELGMVLEVESTYIFKVTRLFTEAGIPCHIIARTRSDARVVITDDDHTLLTSDIRDLRDKWESTSFALERLQADVGCVDQEQGQLRLRSGPYYEAPWTPEPTSEDVLNRKDKPKVAIIREEGSNGDREMSTAFYMAGFEPWDVSVRDLAAKSVNLSDFRGLAFVGGFSYADVLDSAKGWAGVVRFNETVQEQFEQFYRRDDTFSLGICNGCQLMALLERVPFSPHEVSGRSQPRFIHNDSGRYESRFSTVKIEKDSPAIMFKDMAGAQLGVWVAHGEGKAFFPDSEVLEKVLQQNLAPLKYVDDNGIVTQTYPDNPNGSQQGIAGLCSQDGRHLALMPHPERTVLKWQWGFLPKENDDEWQASPWLKMFQNAYDWTVSSDTV